MREITRYEGPFPYIDGLILQVTQNIGRLMVRHLPRAAGRSNYTLRRLLRLWTSMFVNFSVMPLRISTITGFVLSGLGAIGGAAVIVEALIRIAAGGLGLVDGRGVAALGRAADDPRHRRRVSRPALSDRQRQAAIGGEGGPPQPRHPAPPRHPERSCHRRDAPTIFPRQRSSVWRQAKQRKHGFRR